MIESQIALLAAAVPSTDKGKILEQPEEPEAANLVDIHNAARYYIEPSSRGWEDYSMPIKKGDPGRPIIPIAIGPHVFEKLFVISEQVLTLCQR